MIGCVDGDDVSVPKQPWGEPPPSSPAGLVLVALMKRQKLGDKENPAGLLRRDGGQTDEIKA